MRRSATILFFLLLLWAGGSTWWYTCKIKGVCLFDSNTYEDVLKVNLEGERERTFLLKNTGDGILHIEASDDGPGIGFISQYIYNHPEMNLEIVTASDGQADGLLSIFKIMGVGDERMSLFIDPALSRKDRPLTIRSVANAAYTSPSTGNDSLKNTDSALPDIQADNAGSPANPANVSVKPVEATVYEKIPGCPIVTEGEGVPVIGDIFYPTGSSGIRCTSALKNFSRSAKEYLAANPSGKITVTGHTDNDKNSVNNFQLGLQRAVEVRKFMIKQGIPGDKIETFSMGEVSPAEDNATAEGKMMNRRVSIKVYE